MAGYDFFQVLREGIIEGSVGAMRLDEGYALVDGAPLEGRRLNNSQGPVFLIDDDLSAGADTFEYGVSVADEVGFGDVKYGHTIR